MTSNEHEHLDDNAMLVLYLAGELSEEQHQQMASRLARSPELLAQLQELGAAHAAIESGLRVADAAPARPDEFAASQRQVSRMMRQWHAEQARKAAMTVPTESRRLRWWMYPAAAAILLIGWIGWWGQQAGPPEIATTVPAVEPEESAIAEVTPRVPEVIPPPPPRTLYPPYPTEGLFDPASLASAERELDQLELLRTLTQ